MSALRLTLVRHARPLLAAGTCYGRTDCEADPAHTEAVLERLLATLAPQPVASSPALRCRALAERLAAAWRQPCRVDPRLWELDFGAWEGRAWATIPRAEIDAWADAPLDTAPGGGETVRTMDRRVAGWARDAAAAGTDLLAVTHGGVMRLLGGQARGEPLLLASRAPAPDFGALWQGPFPGAA